MKLLLLRIVNKLLYSHDLIKRILYTNEGIEINMTLASQVYTEIALFIQILSEFTFKMHFENLCINLITCKKVTDA